MNRQELAKRKREIRVEVKELKKQLDIAWVKYEDSGETDEKYARLIDRIYKKLTKLGMSWKSQ